MYSTANSIEVKFEDNFEACFKTLTIGLSPFRLVVMAGFRLFEQPWW